MSKKDKKAADSAIMNARTLYKKGMHKQAEEVYRLVLLQDPDNTAALLDLGLALAHRGELDEPQALYKKVLGLDPRNGNAMMALAIVTMETGDRNEALRLAELARGMKPTPQALGRLGVFYRKAGLKEDAITCLTAALRHDPDDVASYFSLQRLNRLPPDSAEFKNLLLLEKKSATLPSADRATLHFTLGNALLDAGDDENAFRHFTEANRLKKGASYFNAEQYTRHVDEMIRAFGNSMPKVTGGNTSERPVFIVGLPRSGSTLVDQIIASHPQARGIGEVRFLPDSLPESFQRAPESITAETLSPAVLDVIAAKYLAATERYAGGAARLADKMLSNFLWIGVIRLALPNAKIIHCTRDPVDTAFSIWQMMFSEGLVPWGYAVEDIGCYFRGYQKLMAHWEKVFPDAIYAANYESLVKNQEHETRKLIEFIGLPWDARCLKFHETGRIVKTASADQVRRPLYGDSVQKWKKYEKYLTPLLESLARKP